MTMKPKENGSKEIPEEEYWTIKDLCYAFKRKPLTILNWRLYSGLPYIVLTDGKLKSTVRFRKKDVMAWATRHKKRMHLGGDISNMTLIEELDEE